MSLVARQAFRKNKQILSQASVSNVGTIDSSQFSAMEITNLLRNETFAGPASGWRRKQTNQHRNENKGNKGNKQTNKETIRFPRL